MYPNQVWVTNDNTIDGPGKASFMSLEFIHKGLFRRQPICKVCHFEMHRTLSSGWRQHIGSASPAVKMGYRDKHLNQFVVDESHEGSNIQIDKFRALEMPQTYRNTKRYVGIPPLPGVEYSKS